MMSQRYVGFWDLVTFPNDLYELFYLYDTDFFLSAGVKQSKYTIMFIGNDSRFFAMGFSTIS